MADQYEVVKWSIDQRHVQLHWMAHAYNPHFNSRSRRYSTLNMSLTVGLQDTHMPTIHGVPKNMWPRLRR